LTPAGRDLKDHIETTTDALALRGTYVVVALAFAATCALYFCSGFLGAFG